MEPSLGWGGDGTVHGKITCTESLLERRSGRLHGGNNDATVLDSQRQKNLEFSASWSSSLEGNKAIPPESG